MSPDGSRVAGAIIENGVKYDCFGRCTLPFVWTASGGTNIQSFLRQIDLYKTEYGTVSLPVEEVVSVTAETALTNRSGGYFNEPFVFAVGGNRLLREVNRESPALFGVAMSDDAKVIVGSIRDAELRRQAVRWTRGTGITAIDIGATNAHATGISGDGRVVVGSSRTSIYDPYNKAFRWSESDRPIILDPLRPNGGSFPSGVSTDGSVIVGTARGDKGYRAYRWTVEEGTAALALPVGFAASAADAVSGNGEIVVGRLLVSNGQDLEAHLAGVLPE